MGKLALFIKQRPALLRRARILYRWLYPFYIHPFTSWGGYFRLFVDWRRYRRVGGQAKITDFYPCLSDRTRTTAIDRQYFHQAIWGMECIRAAAPARHVDIGSDVRWVGVLTCVTQVEFVDIRPLGVDVKNLVCREGSILALPYPSGSVESLSALHVIEHIGLGRYGDPIDPDGTAKACAELVRVLVPGGRLYLSVPLGRPRVQFNGQRVLSVDELLAWLPSLRLAGMAMVDNHGRYLPDVVPGVVSFDEEGGLDYALGCFVFEKPAEIGSGNGTF